MQVLFLGDTALAEENMSGWEWDVPAGLSPGEEQRILFNWEFPLGQDFNPVQRVSGIRYLANPASVPVIQRWAPGFAALATNHILDGGLEGLKTTLDTLKNTGFDTVGAGFSQEEIEKPLIWETRDGSLAVINWVFPETHPDWLASPGPNCWPGTEKAAQMIQGLKKQVDWVVLFLHWSDELFPYPRLEDRQIARQLVSAGADLIVGHHPHVVRGAEKITSRPVFYSIGNFFLSSKINPASSRLFHQPPRNREGVGVIATFRHGAPPAVETLSFWRERTKVILDPHKRAARRLAQASKPLERYHDAGYQTWYAGQRNWFNLWDYRVHFKLWYMHTPDIIQSFIRPLWNILSGLKGTKQDYSKEP